MSWGARGGGDRRATQTAAAAAAAPPPLHQYSNSSFLLPSPFCKLEALHSMLSGDYTEESTGARTLRQSSGGKDRHSKVLTSRGPRDRRVRLSVSTAIRFYDLQDRLGFEQPSKAVDWLLRHAKPAIDALPPLLHLHLSAASSSSSAAAAGLADIDPLQQLLCRPRYRHIMTAAAAAVAEPQVLQLDVDVDHSNNYSASSARSCASTAEDSIGVTEAPKSPAAATAPGVEIADGGEGGCRKRRKWGSKEGGEVQKESSMEVWPPLMEARKWEAELMSAVAPKARRGGSRGRLQLQAQQCEENKAAAAARRDLLPTANATNPNPNPNVNHAASYPNLNTNYPNPNPNTSSNLHVTSTNYANPNTNYAKYDPNPSTTNYSKSNSNTHANSSCNTTNSTHTSSGNATNNHDNNNTLIFTQHSLNPAPNPNNYYFHYHHLLGLHHPSSTTTTTTATTTSAHSPNNDDLLLPDSLLFRKQAFLHGGSLLACDPFDKYLHLPPPDHPSSALIVDHHRSLLAPPPPPRIDISPYNHADIINLHPHYLV